MSPLQVMHELTHPIGMVPFAFLNNNPSEHLTSPYDAKHDGGVCPHLSLSTKQVWISL